MALGMCELEEREVPLGTLPLTGVGFWKRC